MMPQIVELVVLWEYLFSAQVPQVCLPRSPGNSCSKNFEVKSCLSQRRTHLRAGFKVCVCREGSEEEDILKQPNLVAVSSIHGQFLELRFGFHFFFNKLSLDSSQTFCLRICKGRVQESGSIKILHVILNIYRFGHLETSLAIDI